MSNITVIEALELPELQSLEVVAGESGLYREIRDVTVMEVPDPVPWLKGGELLLTTFYGVREKKDAQLELLVKLSSIASGICFNPGAGINLSKDIIKVADELSLPLLRMPGDMPYSTVIRAVLQAILNRKAYLLSRSSEINSMLINTILNGAEAKEVVSTLAKLVKSPVALLDASLNLVAEDPYYEGGQDYLKKGLPCLLTLDVFHNIITPDEHPTYVDLTIMNQSVRVGVKTVMIKSAVYGYLTIWEVYKKFDEVDVYAVAHAATAIALDFIRNINLAEQKQKLINNLCEDLLSGRFVSNESIIKQGEMYGLNIAKLNVIIVVQTDSAVSQVNDITQRPDIPDENDEILTSIRKLAESRFSDCLVAKRSGEFIIAIAAGDDTGRKKRVSDLVANISSTCNRFFNKNSYFVSVGGFSNHFEKVSQSYSQAKAAIKIIKHLSESKRKLFFDDLGIYRLLCEMPNTPEVKQYIEMVLPGSDSCDISILETLEVFIESQKSFSAAGKILYVHPNTVKYRIKKAREIWGDDVVLDSNCLDTLLALKLKKYFDRKVNI